jgi:saccharopine dehydrogenase (NADP+, L-glutamate forming)
LGSVKDRVAQLLETASDDPIMEKLEWLGLFRKKKIELRDATPALILEELLLDKWKLEPDDRDMIVMQHEIDYTLDGGEFRETSNLIMRGEDANDTAMARTVGLPLGIFVRLISEDKIKATGVHIPTMKEVYEPVLEELKEYGMNFTDQTIRIK